MSDAWVDYYFFVTALGVSEACLSSRGLRSYPYSPDRGNARVGKCSTSRGHTLRTPAGRCTAMLPV